MAKQNISYIQGPLERMNESNNDVVKNVPKMKYVRASKSVTRYQHKSKFLVLIIPNYILLYPKIKNLERKPSSKLFIENRGYNSSIDRTANIDKSQKFHLKGTTVYKFGSYAKEFYFTGFDQHKHTESELYDTTAKDFQVDSKLCSEFMYV